MKTETVRVERVVCQLAREVTVSLWHNAPEDARQVVGLTIEVLDPSWEVFGGSALGLATLTVWAYCLVAGGVVRAISWTEGVRVFVEDAALRCGMRVEACFRVVLKEAWVDGGDARETGGGAHRIGVVATVRIDGLVLETVALPVVTAVQTLERCADSPHAEEKGTGQPTPGGAQVQSRCRHSWIMGVLERLRRLATR